MEHLHLTTDALGTMRTGICKLATVAANVAGATFALVVQESRLHRDMLGAKAVAHVAYMGAMFSGARVLCVRCCG
jgi:hypothetical protein